MEKQPFKNTILRRFSPEIIARLQLRPIQFAVGQDIESPGQPIRNLYFLEQGMASMTNTFEDGAQVEVGMFGFESVIGVSALMGTKLALNRIYTQIGGWGYGCTYQAAKTEYDRSGLFQRLVLGYVQAQLFQAIQTAGCNAMHSCEQRLARWLLITADRADIDQFAMSQELLSHMLGMARPTVTIAAGHLKDEKLIEYVRGEIRIIDRKGLEAQACECYWLIRRHLTDYQAFDTGNTT
jgi:CRP-like cAMP-binding protein